jgi:hypothetical protein
MTADRPVEPVVEEEDRVPPARFRVVQIGSASLL